MNEQDEYIETTAEDFEIFKAECRRWIEIFGLKNWKVYYDHCERDGTLGSCFSNLNAMCVTIMLGKKWTKFAYEQEGQIKRTAFHEVCELLMTAVDANARHRYITEDDLTESIHAVIQILENVLYPKYPAQ